MLHLLHALVVAREVDPSLWTTVHNEIAVEQDPWHERKLVVHVCSAGTRDFATLGNPRHFAVARAVNSAVSEDLVR